MLYIVATAWMYVVLMMAITERSVIAGIMTFLLYGVLPLSIIIYLISTPARKKRRATVKNPMENPMGSSAQQPVLPQENVSDMTPEN